MDKKKLSRADHPIKILNYCVLAMIVLLIAGYIVIKLGSMVMGIVLMTTGICCVVVAITVFWRCPKCDEVLTMGAYKTKTCPFCGNKLD